MSSWLDLERRFLEFEDQLRYARLDHQSGVAGEHWHIAAASNRLAISRFEAVARLAGKKLLGMVGTEQYLPCELRDSFDDAIRWYRAMKLQSGHFVQGPIGFQKNEDGSGAGTIFIGHIYSPAAVAGTLCLKFSNMANDTPTSVGQLTVNISGSNARLNISSTDNSSNTYSETINSLFESLRAVIPDQASIELRAELLSKIEQMEYAVGKPTFSSRYNDFIQSAANHLAVFAPLLPALSGLLPK